MKLCKRKFKRKIESKSTKKIKGCLINRTILIEIMEEIQIPQFTIKLHHHGLRLQYLMRIWINHIGKLENLLFIHFHMKLSENIRYNDWSYVFENRHPNYNPNANERQSRSPFPISNRSTTMSPVFAPMSPVFASSNANLRGTRGSHIQYPRPQFPASPLTIQRSIHSPLPFNYSAPKPYRAPSFSPITHQG